MAIHFVSLGMVVLDEIRFPDGETLYNVPGGSGLYSTLGARMASSAPKSVGCLVLAGGDFPSSVEKALIEWDVTLLLKKDIDRLSTRGLLQYRGINFKDRVFSYTTPTLQPTPADLASSDSIQLLSSTAFHFLAPPEDLVRYTSQLMELRTTKASPIIAWEPLPSSCTPANKEAHLKAARVVDIYSPNHVEFLSIFNQTNELPTREPVQFNLALLERHSMSLLDSGIGPTGTGTIVIRCAEHGSFLVSRTYPGRWFPEFYLADKNPDRVVDATGAGNAFLGAFTLRFGETGDLTEAAIFGSVAASFVIEQIGVPEFTRRNGYSPLGGGEEDMGMWNGVRVLDRVEEYRAVL